MITLESRPKLAGKARLRRDRRMGDGGAWLLFPEAGLRLNGSAREILAQCTGGQTVAQIVDRLAGEHGETDREAIARDVLAFLDALARRGLLRDERGAG
jgi:coenzyme PQQ biosynthesis protein PqqD